VARSPRKAVAERPAFKLPNDAFLCAALGSMGLSVLFQTVRLRRSSLLVAQWVPALLLLGVYSKMLELAEDSSAAGARAAVRE
jgi:hypothetical protein